MVDKSKPVPVNPDTLSLERLPRTDFSEEPVEKRFPPQNPDPPAETTPEAEPTADDGVFRTNVD